MTQEPVSEKWSDWFCRVADRDAKTPRFSIIGSKSSLYEYDGYRGGHEELDRIIKLLRDRDIDCYVSSTDSPMNVSSFRYSYDFEGCGLEIYSGNYLFHPPGQGAFIVGFKAFRWLLDQLGIKQPRRFKNEIAAE